LRHRALIKFQYPPNTTQTSAESSGNTKQSTPAVWACSRPVPRWANPGLYYINP